MASVGLLSKVNEISQIWTFFDLHNIDEFKSFILSTYWTMNGLVGKQMVWIYWHGRKNIAWIGSAILEVTGSNPCSI